MRRPRIPSYRHYKPKDLGLVVLGGRYHYLGKYTTPESLAEYHDLVQEWLAGRHAGPRAGAPAPALTVSALTLAFWWHAEQHYRDPDGTPTRELDNSRRRRYSRRIARSMPRRRR